MSYVAPDPAAFLGQIVGDGQCVAYVKTAAGCPTTRLWAEGAKVRGSGVARFTAIATFQNGTYNNHTDGRSHAAILIEDTPEGLRVFDQWVGQPVHERLIRFKGGQGKPSNDGDAFAVIEDVAVVARLERARLQQAVEGFKTPARTRPGARKVPSPRRPKK